MLTRRVFGGCAICAAASLVAGGADAQAQPAQAPGITRHTIQTTDLDEKHTAILMVVDFAPGASAARHTHPGIESSYIVEGATELSMQGQPDRTVKAGEGFQVPPNTPHSARIGDRPTKIAITYVVEKGKPLASPA